MRESDFYQSAYSYLIHDDPKAWRTTLWVVCGFCVGAFLWSNWAQLDEITRGQGRVIPSQKMQVVQNLEGGILAQILVKEGQMVDKDQILMIIDDTKFASSLRENEHSMQALKLKKARLNAEYHGKSFEVPQEWQQQDPKAYYAEKRLYDMRVQDHYHKMAVLEEQKKQREQEAQEARTRWEHVQKSLSIAQREAAILKPLQQDGTISTMEWLAKEREINTLEGECQSARSLFERAQSSVKEHQQRMTEASTSYRSTLLSEYNEVRNELNRQQAGHITLEDRVNRAVVRSPVKGVINLIKHATLGAIVQPGEELMQIVPIDDALVIEARIRPQDIGFLRPGMPAMVKLTAYDFSIYGGLSAHVRSISPDLIASRDGQEGYYRVELMTDEACLHHKGKTLPVMTGMMASVDILTGQKTVMDYLLKPLLKTKQNAMTER